MLRRRRIGHVVYLDQPHATVGVGNSYRQNTASGQVHDATEVATNKSGVVVGDCGSQVPAVCRVGPQLHSTRTGVAAGTHRHEARGNAQAGNAVIQSYDCIAGDRKRRAESR